MVSNDPIRQKVEKIYRTESRRVLATLIRLLGDFDLAEDALHEAFKAALEQWVKTGVPSNPRAWLVSTGRFKAIDRHRRLSRFNPLDATHTEHLKSDANDPLENIDPEIKDDQLRLIFTCCHPALSQDARVALTLREVCGLTTEEIAHAFLVTPSTLAQRIVRAKAKIRTACIPYQVPPQEELSERLDALLQVIYLVFNEGYYTSTGSYLTRIDLSAEAIRLGRLLAELSPDPEVDGILALMMLHESRRAARSTQAGDLILLEDQDRSLWNRKLIAEGQMLLKQALASNRFGPYTLQAAIAAVHAEAPSADQTDWTQIAGLYSLLMRLNPSPVIELNRAVAIAMRDGPLAGLKLIDKILDREELTEYHLAHSARAELCYRLGQREEARTGWELALSLAKQKPERRFLEYRLARLEADKKDITVGKSLSSEENKTEDKPDQATDNQDRTER
jgi:RNA polymerase sigma-70 factor, ECF subfamily